MMADSPEWTSLSNEEFEKRVRAIDSLTDEQLDAVDGVLRAAIVSPSLGPQFSRLLDVLQSIVGQVVAPAVLLSVLMADEPTSADESDEVQEELWSRRTRERIEHLRLLYRPSLREMFETLGNELDWRAAKVSAHSDINRSEESEPKVRIQILRRDNSHLVFEAPPSSAVRLLVLIIDGFAQLPNSYRRLVEVEDLETLEASVMSLRREVDSSDQPDESEETGD